MMIDATHLYKAQAIIDVECAKMDAFSTATIEELHPLRRHVALAVYFGDASVAFGQLDSATLRGVSSWATREYRREMVEKLAKLAAACQRWVASELQKWPEDFK